MHVELVTIIKLKLKPQNTCMLSSLSLVLGNLLLKLGVKSSKNMISYIPGRISEQKASIKIQKIKHLKNN